MFVALRPSKRNLEHYMELCKGIVCRHMEHTCNGRILGFRISDEEVISLIWLRCPRLYAEPDPFSKSRLYISKGSYLFCLNCR
jgi:hypothetical protein